MLALKDTQSAREHFLCADQQDESSVREGILTSWRRSQALSVQADHLDPPFIRRPNLDDPLGLAAAPVLRHLADGLADEPVSVILTSADGVVLSRTVLSRFLYKTLDGVLLVPGYSYSEQFAGTNGIGTALATRQPALVRGAEHYSERLDRLTCAGSPIIHPISGALLGALDLTGLLDNGGEPLLTMLARSAAYEIEQRLLAVQSWGEVEIPRVFTQRLQDHSMVAGALSTPFAVESPAEGGVLLPPEKSPSTQDRRLLRYGAPPVHVNSPVRWRCSAGPPPIEPPAESRSFQGAATPISSMD
ncbi:GAF domain-containing protein [Rhodococcus erythropolis]|uniref:GAF domain-containing protein n=1 Tax=Rhodococcus erythropolis TaxID=1833 RepID=UPI001FD844D4|nr:GAF domain-containing protein [Rhodococcus erythropolis]